MIIQSKIHRALLIVTLAIAGLSNTAFADKERDGPVLNVGIGYAGTNYGDSANNLITSIQGLGDSWRFRFDLDLGIYFRLLSDSTLIGPVIYTLVDNIGVTTSGIFTSNSYTISIIQTAPSASIQHYLLGTIGSGVFVRGDLGLGLYLLSATDKYGKEVVPSKTNAGLAMQVGVGGAIPFGKLVKGGLSVLYSRFVVADSNSSNLAINANVMFTF